MKIKKFGTPLKGSAVKLMLLGSGELGKEVVIEAMRFGIEVIACDRYEDAPAMLVANSAYVFDMRDGEALRHVVEAVEPDFIVPEIEAIATDTLVELEKEGWTIIPTARAAQLTMDRRGIRKLAAEKLKLPTSPYRFAASLEELQAGAAAVGFPCFIKPTMSSSGHGQSVARKPADVAKSWKIAMEGTRASTGLVIVEGAIDFDYEITLLTVRHEDGFGFCEPIGHVQVDGDYRESWQPAAVEPAVLDRCREVARTITDGLGGRGIFGVELFVAGEEVIFSEVSPRPHDTGMVTMATQWQNEFELHARAILGLPVDTTLKSPGASAVIYGGVEARGIVFDGVDAALQVPGTELRLFGKPESFTKRRMGVALAHDADVERARTRAKQAAALVRPRAV